MFALAKIGPAATALGNAVAPGPQFRSSMYGASYGAAFAEPRGPTIEEADAFAWHAEESWQKAPGLGRVIGAAIGIGAVAWLASRNAVRK